MALIVPPLPAPSRPSKMMHTLSPACFTHSCSCTSSTCRSFRIFAYSLFVNAAFAASGFAREALGAGLRASAAFVFSCFFDFFFRANSRAPVVAVISLALRHRRPAVTGIVLAHRARAQRRARSKISLIDLAVLIHDERHDAGAAIFGRIGNDRKAADRPAVNDVIERAARCALALALEHPIVVAAVRGGTALLLLVALAG